MKTWQPIFCFLLAIPGHTGAQTKCAVFYEKGEPSLYTPASLLDSAVFENSGSLLTFHMNDSRKATLAPARIDSICFENSPKGAAAMPYAFETVSQMFSKSDVPSFQESPEPPYSSFKDGDLYYNDYFENYTVEKTISIEFSNGSASIPSSLPKSISIKRNGAHVTVSNTKGHVKFVLSGTTADGSFTLLDMDDDSKKCHIQLNGANITNPKGPAINIQSGKAVYLSLAQGKDNYLKDGANYDAADGQDRKAALFSEGQIIINGAGNLYITSKGGHAMCSDDYIRIRSGVGRIVLASDYDGINTKEKFVMYGGNVEIAAKSDGIQVREGHIELYGGKLTVKSVDDGLKANFARLDTAYLNISGGYQRIETSGTKGHAVNVTGNITFNSGSATMLKSTGNGSKCLKSDSNISIASSTLYLMNTAGNLSGADDTAKARAISLEGNLEIGKSCQLFVNSAKTGIYCGGNCTISGGQTFISTANPEKCLNVKGSVTQYGGLLVTGPAEQ